MIVLMSHCWSTLTHPVFSLNWVWSPPSTTECLSVLELHCHQEHAPHQPELMVMSYFSEVGVLHTCSFGQVNYFSSESLILINSDGLV